MGLSSQRSVSLPSVWTSLEAADEADSTQYESNRLVIESGIDSYCSVGPLHSSTDNAEGIQ
jgi:hypothetical protein